MDYLKGIPMGPQTKFEPLIWIIAKTDFPLPLYFLDGYFLLSTESKQLRTLAGIYTTFNLIPRIYSCVNYPTVKIQELNKQTKSFLIKKAKLA